MTGSKSGRSLRLVAATRASNLSKIDGRVAHVLVLNGVALALEPAGLDASATARRAHSVVTSLWLAGPTLPGGVSSVFSRGTQEARDWLSTRQEALRGALISLEGLGEYVLAANILPSDGDVEPPRTRPVSRAMGGAAYLRARAEAMEAATQRSDTFRSAVLSLEMEVSRGCRSALTLLRARRGGGVDICVLAPLDAQPNIKEAADRANSRLAVSMTGPWPPYSFAEVALGGSGEARAA